jgi:hypothetical protein
VLVLSSSARRSDGRPGALNPDFVHFASVNYSFPSLGA